LRRDHLAAAIRAAPRAGAMEQRPLAALRAVDRVRRGERIVGATLVALRRRRATLRESHGLPSFSVRELEASERRESTLVAPRFDVARTRTDVAIRSTLRTESLAIVAAERHRRQPEDGVLDDEPR